MENGQVQMSKKERRMQRRQEKAENKISHEKKKAAQRVLKIVIQAVFLLLIFGFIGWKLTRPKTGQSIADLGNDHIQSIDTKHIAYNSTPPTSGPHLGHKAPWGVSDAPIPNELQVHNLEDGGVMVQYWCGDGSELIQETEATSTEAFVPDYQVGCPELVKQLEEIIKKYSERVILAPYPDLPLKIALTAWTRIDTLDAFDEKRIVDFINAYQGIDHHVK